MSGLKIGICKKDYYNILFKGNSYSYEVLYSSSSNGRYLFVEYYDEDGDLRHEYFDYEYDFNEYFYSEAEVRKLKLKKLSLIITDNEKRR